MSEHPLRFLHAADLHLERTLGGVAELPDHLRSIFLEAPYQAAEQIFETALAEQVDALLLAGDVVCLERAGPRAAVFLLEQFRRLADHGITVYWAGGNVDPPDAWPPNTPLPENVHVFPVGRVESFEHERDGTPVARIQGISRSQGKPLDDSGFHRDAHGLFTVGIAHGTAAAPGEEGDRVHYMALGGQHRRQTVDQSPGIAHYAGTPQGRTPRETGVHGCTLVTVDQAGHVKSRQIPTDAIRWIAETVEITAGVDESALIKLLENRIERVRSKHAGQDLLVSWQIEGRGELVNYLRRGGLTDELLTRLRRRFGKERPAVWSVAIECEEPLDVPGEWYDEETIMGDMLRQFRELSASPEIPLELEAFLPDECRDGPWASDAEVRDDQREALLLAASKLGMELLTAHDEPGDDETLDD